MARIHRRFKYIDEAIQIHGPLARYVKLRVVHAVGMPRTFPPSPRVCDPDMHQDTCVMHSFEVGGGENGPGIPGACTTRHITHLVRGPFQKQIFGDAMILVHGTMATWIIRIQYCE